MLSRDCDGCGLMSQCKKQFITVKKGEFVYCPILKHGETGSKHLVDIEQEWIKT